MTDRRMAARTEPAGKGGAGRRADDESGRRVDEASEHSMDASDPPSYNPGTVGVGKDRRSTGDPRRAQPKT